VTDKLIPLAQSLLTGRGRQAGGVTAQLPRRRQPRAREVAIHTPEFGAQAIRLAAVECRQTLARSFGQTRFTAE
jgi:hypothetical protein